MFVEKLNKSLELKVSQEIKNLIDSLSETKKYPEVEVEDDLS